MDSRWLVLLEKGCTHAIGFDTTPEEALAVVYDGVESATGLPRDKCIRVVGMINLSEIRLVNASLSQYNLELVPIDRKKE
jgi:hypothetical protein